MARRLIASCVVAASIVGVVAGLLGSAQAASKAAGAIVVPPPTTLKKWNADTDNLIPIQGTVEWGGKPVSGASVRVDTFLVPSPTDAQGHFTYLVDGTLMGRHVVKVANASQAKVGGVALTSDEQSALSSTQGAITVDYGIKNLKVSRDSSGRPVVTGQLADSLGVPPSPVGLFTYQLTGTVVDSDGKPVVGAQVSTRTEDRDYWTVSTFTDSQGRYSSLFTASAETAGQPGAPVPFTVRVSKGDLVYQFLPLEFVDFDRLKSATLNIQLPPQGFPLALPLPRSYPGAIYQGVVVGVAQGDQAVRPAATTWPDKTGHFSITLPKSMAGKTVSLWEGRLQLFSKAEAVPGGSIDLQNYPATLPASVPRDLASVTLK
ncbi:MAG TPA: carboxypeptidase-like regulatory domain-containing protein [Gaiellaceae bacterium]|nr:carboxypeptidase-like regulatory domain-containing protein [Gaiellaceae bacterium]